VKKRTIKVLVLGLAAAGLSAGLATTALAASGRPAAAHPASAAAVTGAGSAQGNAVNGAVNSGSSPQLTVVQLTAEIRQLKALQAAGRASAAQVVKLHQLEAELAQLTAKN
jgi:hypothetical protein